MADPSPLFEAIVTGDASSVAGLVNEALARGETAQAIMEHCLVPAMSEVGNRFECNEYFVPDLLLADRAMKVAMAIIDPLLRSTGIAKIGRVVIGTVQGDLHDIGKNLVGSMLEGGGFEVVDLGVDVEPNRFVAAAKEHPGTIIGLSALLTTTMPQMKKVILALEEAGLRQSSKVMIGGAPVTQEFANEIGADGYSANAGAAVTLAKQLAA